VSGHSACRHIGVLVEDIPVHILAEVGDGVGKFRKAVLNLHPSTLKHGG
jgi:hypothetical protein